MNSTPNDDGDLLIEEDGPAQAAAPEAAPWRVLIVDDDVDVHVVTKFALSHASFEGRRLCFLHAYSGAEAIDILKKTPDVALVLLDVIMETEDAGLRVARRIREELHNDQVRVVLRTGQPGQALEHSIIVDYDINDFWCKADLTNRKLFTTVIASLRAYAAQVAADRARAALNADLERVQNMQVAFDQHALMLTLDAQARIVQVNDRFCEVTGLARDALMGNDMHVLHPQPYPEPLASQMVLALTSVGSWSGDIRADTHDGGVQNLHATVVAFKDGAGKVKQFVAVATVLPPK